MVLGLVPPFTLNQARDQFRALARIYHPDAGKSADAEHFKVLGEALRTVEANEDLFASGALILKSGAGRGSGESSTAARMQKESNEINRKLVQAENDLKEMSIEREFLELNLSKALKRRINPKLLAMGYLILLVGVAALAVLLSLRSQPRVSTLEGREWVIETTDFLSVKDQDSTSTYRIRLDGVKVRIPAVTLISDQGKTNMQATTEAVTLVTTADSRLQVDLPAADVAIDEVILVDPYHPDSASRTVYAILNEGRVTVPSQLLQFSGTGEGTTLTLTSKPLVSLRLSNGFVHVKTPSVRTPSDWPQKHVPPTYPLEVKQPPRPLPIAGGFKPYYFAPPLPPPLAVPSL